MDNKYAEGKGILAYNKARYTGTPFVMPEDVSIIQLIKDIDIKFNGAIPWVVKRISFMPSKNAYATVMKYRLFGTKCFETGIEGLYLMLVHNDEIIMLFEGDCFELPKNSGMLFRGSRMVMNDIWIGEIDLTGLDTSKVESMESMFADNSRLMKVSLADMDASHVKTMRKMFWRCEALYAVDLSGVYTPCLEDTSMMFEECFRLMHVSMRSFDTSHVKTMDGMFADCECLTDVDLSSFESSESVTMQNMFFGSLVSEIHNPDPLLQRALSKRTPGRKKEDAVESKGKNFYKQIPAKWRAAVKDCYHDEDGWWICLDCDGDYILEGYESEYTVHEDLQRDALAAFKSCIKKKPNSRN